MKGDAPTTRDDLKITGKRGRILLFSFLGIAAGLLLVATLAFQTQRAQVRTTVEDQLRAVGELKTLQIQAWIKERKLESQYAGHGTEIGRDFDAWVRSGGDDPIAQRQLQEHITSLRTGYDYHDGYHAIALYDLNGDYRIGSEAEGYADEVTHGSPHRDEALKAIKRHEPFVIDLHTHADAGDPGGAADHEGEILLGVMAPLMKKDGKEEEKVGAMLLALSAKRALLPLLKAWPLSTSHGETLLARREGEQVHLLYSSSGESGTILNILAEPSLALVRGAQGEQGALERATNHAGDPVLAYSASIPGTPWVFVAQQALAEAEAPVRRLAWNYGFANALLFSALILIYGLTWRVERRRHQLTLLDQEIRTARMEKEAQQALIESEEKYRILADYSADWEYWAGPNGRFLYISPACARVCGHTPDDFLADPGLLERLIHPDDRPPWHAHLQRPPDPTHAEHEQLLLRIRTRNGSERWIEHVCAPVFDSAGNYRGRRGSNRDITERKQAEAAVHRLNAELEERVKRRTAELETAVKDLEGFSYSVSHDLRAPLRAIDGFVSVLAEDYAPQLDDEGQRFLRIVSDNANKMGHLIDDILAFSRAGRLELERKEVDMQALVNEVWNALAGERGERPVEFHLDNLPTACGDPHALRQVWQNLLANAIKFTRGRDPAVIKVTAEQHPAETCYTVKDNGVGFNPDYVGKLFVLFQRLHGMDEFEGTGVGLAIVHRFVQKHRGRVEADGRPDEGATFRFTLPHPST